MGQLDKPCVILGGHYFLSSSSLIVTEIYIDAYDNTKPNLMVLLSLAQMLFACPSFLSRKQIGVTLFLAPHAILGDGVFDAAAACHARCPGLPSLPPPVVVTCTMYSAVTRKTRKQGHVVICGILQIFGSQRISR